MSQVRVAFTTCVQLGYSCIEKILDMGGKPDLLITLRDERAREKSGRVYLDKLAQDHRIPLLKIDNINDQAVLDAVKSMKIDWLFVVGWSQIVKPELLSLPHKGCIGMHPTLLPMGRGRAAIPWAIIRGLDKTGVTMFRLDEGVDTGDILGQVEIPLTEHTTATQLYQQVDEAHIALLEKYWHDIKGDCLRVQKQDETRATVWEGRRPEDGQLYHTMTMQEADRMVRAVTHPYPGAFYWEGNKKVVIWSAQMTAEPCEMGFQLADGYLKPMEYEKKEENQP